MRNNEDLLSLANSNEYLTPLKYVSGRIVEYDICAANITMLRKYNMIDDAYYNYLKALPKMDREVEIGLLIRSNIKYYDIISTGIKEAKKLLFESNNIDVNNIVRIANDAVYINQSSNLQFTQFDDVIFKQKSVSNSMIVLNKLIIFFWYDNNGINIEVKGINEQAKKLHLNYMLSFIANVMYLVERVSLNDAINFISKFYADYISLNLPIEYYRELSPESLYHYKDSDFYLLYINDDTKSIDINYNLYLIREVWSIILEKYNSTISRR